MFISFRFFSDGLFPLDDFPAVLHLLEWLQDCLHAINLLLRPDQDLVVLEIVFKLLLFAVELLLVDKDTEGSWHSPSSSLGLFGLAVSF